MTPLRSASSPAAAPSALTRICPACDHANPDDARFCNACGSPVHLRECRDCGAINDDAALACYKCGAGVALRPIDGEAPASGDPFPSPADRVDQQPSLLAAPQATIGGAPDISGALPMLEECPHCEAVNDPGATLCHACEAPLTDLLDRNAVNDGPTEKPHDPLDTAVIPHDGARCTKASDDARPREPPPAPQDLPVIECAMAPVVDTSGVTWDASVAQPSAPVHYVGVLTAPADEAELERADPHLSARRARRIGWTVTALVLAPSLAVMLLYAVQHRDQMAEVIAYAKALIVTPRASAEPPPRIDRAPAPES